MIDSVQALGNTVKRARDKLSRTQCDVANAMDVDVRTIINIENYRGNPKFEMLFSLIRTLKIDANEIFYPELNRTSPQLNKLHSLIGKCNEEEAALLIRVMEAICALLRSDAAIRIEIKRSSHKSDRNSRALR